MIDRDVSFLPLRLEGILTAESAGEDVLRGWLFHALANEPVVPLRCLGREQRLEARRALERVRRERKKKAKARDFKGKTYRVRKEKRKKMLSLACAMVRELKGRVEGDRKQDEQQILVEGFESLNVD